jgi:hypothetical protein
MKHEYIVHRVREAYSAVKLPTPVNVSLAIDVIELYDRYLFVHDEKKTT